MKEIYTRYNCYEGNTSKRKETIHLGGLRNNNVTSALEEIARVNLWRQDQKLSLLHNIIITGVLGRSSGEES